MKKNTIGRALAALSLLSLAGCAALASLFGTAAPIVAQGLGAYEVAVEQARQRAELPVDDPRVVGAQALACTAQQAEQLATAKAADELRARETADAALLVEAIKALGLAQADAASSKAAFAVALATVRGYELPDHLPDHVLPTKATDAGAP